MARYIEGKFWGLHPLVEEHAKELKKVFKANVTRVMDSDQHPGMAYVYFKIVVER